MTEVKVRLIDWEHECCGDVRHVGDSVTMTVFNDDGQLIEQRHDYQNELRGQPITGHIVAIEWRPAVLTRVAERSYVIDGYGPAVTLASTDDRPEGDSWAFDFTVEPVGVIPVVEPEGKT